MKLTVAQRKMFAELVIGLSICGAAYYFLVQPLKKELAAVRAQTSATMAVATVPTPPDPAKLAAIIQSVKDKSERIAAGGVVARSEAEMFSRLGSLAKRFDVRIDELRSVSKSTISVASPAAPAPAPGPPAGPPGGPPGGPIDPIAGLVIPPKDTRVQYEFSARGAYPSVAAFLAAIGTDLGHSVVRTVRLSPAGATDPKMLSVSVRTEHADFDVAAVNAALTAPPGPPGTPGSPGTPGTPGVPPLAAGGPTR
jgi:hypothetical protein